VKALAAVLWTEISMRKAVILAVLAVIVLIIAVQFGPSLVSR
jgi:hypothetical protein